MTSINIYTWRGIQLKLLREGAKLPVYSTAGSACFDLFALTEGNNDVIFFPRERKIINTVLSFEVPSDMAMMLYSRSGQGFNHGVRLANCVGVIDSDYRGEVKICVTNDGSYPFTIKSGDRVAQGMIIYTPKIMFMESLFLSQTERGDQGFGSTGI